MKNETEAIQGLTTQKRSKTKVLKNIYRCFWVVCPCIAGIFIGGCSTPEKSTSSEIIAGTSLIADIISDLTDSAVTTHTMLPSSACPSQFDLKTSDIGKLQQAKLIFLHPWQLQLANIRRVLDAAKVSEEQMRVVEVVGNWMLPEIHTAAVNALATMLGDLYPDQRNIIHLRAKKRIAAIKETINQAREMLSAATTTNTPVMCNEMQAPFIRWAGFDVVATYARPEDWSVAETERLVQLGRERNVALVIDNLQSGGLRMSETLARDMDAVNVVVSNFPNGFPDTPTWEATFMDNINRLREALAHSVAP